MKSSDLHGIEGSDYHPIPYWSIKAYGDHIETDIRLRQRRYLRRALLSFLTLLGVGCRFRLLHY
jgi:hypothetical protein